MGGGGSHGDGASTLTAAATGSGGSGTTGGSGAGGSGTDGSGAGTGGSGGAGGFSGAGGVGGGGTAPDAGSGNDSCTLVWSPAADRDGKNAFEGLEMPDMWGAHPGAVHFSTVAEHNAFRIDQHYMPPTIFDYDDHNTTDRMRCEVKGMKTPSGNLQLLQGQRWRLAWSLYIPSTLKSPTRFCHIMQIKVVDTNDGSSGAPVVTISLPRDGSTEKIQLQVPAASGDGNFPAVDLAPLHDKWLSTQVDIKIGAGTSGSVRWVLSDGTRLLVDFTRAGIETWPTSSARLRPKWGIYRSLEDTSGALQTTYLLLSDLKAYTCL